MKQEVCFLYFSELIFISSFSKRLLFFHTNLKYSSMQTASRKRKKSWREFLVYLCLFISYSPSFMTCVVVVFTASFLSCLPLAGSRWNTALDVPPRRGAEFYRREQVQPEPHRINTGVWSAGAWRAISRRTAPWVITGSAAAPHAS